MGEVQDSNLNELAGWDTYVLSKHSLTMLNLEEPHRELEDDEDFMKKVLRGETLSFKVNNTKGITLRNLTEAVYRLKLDKYEIGGQKVSLSLKNETFDSYEFEVSF